MRSERKAGTKLAPTQVAQRAAASCPKLSAERVATQVRLPVRAARAQFQAAALADFRVEGAGTARKMSSRAGTVTLTLVPATKLITRLRELFPKAWIVGWKYELDGTREDVLTKAQRQLAENRTDVCVANGAAYGEGFGIVRAGAEVEHCPNKVALCEWLAQQLGR